MKAAQGNSNKGILVGVLIALAVVGAVGALVMDDVVGKKGSGLSEAYDIDAVKLARFDPNLLRYQEMAPPMPTGFARARGLALDAEGRFYVAGDEAIRVLSRTGNLERVITLSREPRCVAVAPDGKAYVGLRDHVEVFDADGQRLGAWTKLGLRAFLTSIVVAKDEVLVADAGNAVVIRYDMQGTVLGRIGQKDTERNVPGLQVPSPYFDIAMAPDGLLRVVSPGRLRIEAYTLDGDLEFWWGENGMGIEAFCGCCNPVNFAMLPDGRYVTAEKGLIRVKVHDPDGAFREVVAGPEQLVEGGASRVFESVDDARTSGFDVAVDPEGRVYVLDTIENTIRVFDRQGKG